MAGPFDTSFLDDAELDEPVRNNIMAEMVARKRLAEIKARQSTLDVEAHALDQEENAIEVALKALQDWRYERDMGYAKRDADRKTAEREEREAARAERAEATAHKRQAKSS